VAAAAGGGSEADQEMFAKQKAEQEESHKLQMQKMQEEFEAQLKAMQDQVAAGSVDGEGATQKDIDKAKQAFEAKQQAAEENFQDNAEISGVQRELQDLMRKAPQMSQMCQMLDRPMLGFEVKLSPGANPGDPPEPKVIVRNSETREEIIQAPKEFTDRYQIIEEELQNLQNAIEFGTDYNVPEQNDPIMLLFDNLFKLGSANYSLMEYALLFPTDQPKMDIRRAVAPFNKVGTLDCVFTPIKGPDDRTPLGDDDIVDDPEELLGKPWTYELEVRGVEKLPLVSDETLIQFTFNTEAIATQVETESVGKDIKMGFKHILHVPSVTQEFLTYLDECSVTFDVFVNPSVAAPKSQVSSSNNNIRAFLSGGKAVPAATEASISDYEMNRQKAAAEQSLCYEQDNIVKLEAQIAALEKRAADPSQFAGRLTELEGKLSEYQNFAAQSPQSGTCTLS